MATSHRILLQVKYNIFNLLHKNNDDIKVLLSHNDILSTDGLNVVTYSDSYAKLCFTTMIVRALTSSQGDTQSKTHKRVLYIDTDTAFTAYLMAGLILKDPEASLDSKNAANVSLSSVKDTTNGIIRTGKDGNDKDHDDDDNNVDVENEDINKDKRLVQVFLSSEGRFESLLGEAIASMKEASIVILDSLNSFYNMYPIPYPKSRPTRQSLRESRIETQKNDISTTTALASQPSIQELSKDEKPRKSAYTINRLNHLLSVFIMLLVKHGVYYNIPILVTSMIRYKKVSEDIWVKSPTCRRLLHQKGVVRLSVEMSGEKDLSVNIMKHPSIAQQTIVYPDAGISLRPAVNHRKP